MYRQAAEPWVRLSVVLLAFVDISGRSRRVLLDPCRQSLARLKNHIIGPQQSNDMADVGQTAQLTGLGRTSTRHHLNSIGVGDDELNPHPWTPTPPDRGRGVMLVERLTGWPRTRCGRPSP